MSSILEAYKQSVVHKTFIVLRQSEKTLGAAILLDMHAVMSACAGHGGWVILELRDLNLRTVVINK
jgi:hypothetical protein